MADDRALINLALSLRAQPSHTPAPEPGTSVLSVTDPATGETRSLKDIDLTRPRFEQLQDRPRQRMRGPGEDAFIGATDPRAKLRGMTNDLRQLPGFSQVAGAVDTVFGTTPPDKGDPITHVGQMPGLGITESQMFQLDPVAVMAPGEVQTDLPMDIGSRMERSKLMGFGPERWYHGTTHDFDTFQMDRANPDSFFGRGFYFTSTADDAGKNYTIYGPDLEKRIGLRAEEIESEIVDKEYEGHNPPWDSEERSELIARSKQQARQELVGPHKGATLPIRLKMKNPVRLTHDDAPTWLDFSAKLDDDGELIEDSPLFQHLDTAMKKLGKEFDFEAEKVLDELYGTLYPEEIKAVDFDQRVMDAFGKSNQFPTYPDNGRYAGGEVRARLFRELGYDGIIMDAGKQFNYMLGVTPQTRHAIVFEPHQIRSTQAVFDPAKANSGNILHADPFGVGAGLQFMASHPRTASTAIGATTGGLIGSDMDSEHPVRGALAGAVTGGLAGYGIGRAAEKMPRPGVPLTDRIKDDLGAVGRITKRWNPAPKVAQFKFTDLPVSARPSSVYKAIIEHEGYTVDPHTGLTVKPGDEGPVMAGKYPNGNTRTLKIERSKFNPDVVAKWFKQNYDALSKKGRYIGGWISEGNVYLDIAEGHKDIRKATKVAERQMHPQAARNAEGELQPRGQLAVWDPKTGEHPVGNAHEFINSPEFKDRMTQMREVGANAMAGKSWWDLTNGPIERVYGSENLPRVAGMIASTSPQQPVEMNLRLASEYVRRLLKGEEINQPFWRAPKGSVGIEPGSPMLLANTHKNNVERVADWRMDELRADKVNDMYRALMGDVDAAVFDRHWAKLADAPERGVFSDREANKLTGPMSAGGKRTPYADIENVVRDAAKAAGMTPAEYSAQVWEGIRDTIRKTGKLFEQTHDASAIPPGAEGFNEVFTRLVQEKANARNISVEEFEKRLKNGDATLLAVMLSTGVGLEALTSWKASDQQQ